jgi:hypothetical protein
MVDAARNYTVMIFSKLQRMAPRRRRRIIIIASVVLVALLVAIYAFWSMNIWNSYKTTYESWHKELRTSINSTMALPAATPAERAKKVTAFQGTSSKIDTAKQSLCRTPGLITWQHAIYNLRQREEACTQIIGEADMFGKKMQATTNYLKSEQALASAIATALAASEGKVTEETWGSQVATWQDASKAIAKISSAESLFVPLKTSATEKVTSIQTAWQDVIAAHTAKDKAKYSEAQTKLIAAYAALSSISTVNAEQLSKLTTPLESAYADLLSSKV